MDVGIRVLATKNYKITSRVLRQATMKCTTRSLAIAGIFIVLGMVAIGYFMSDDVIFSKEVTAAAPAPASEGVSLSSSSINDDGILNHSDDQLMYA